MKVEAVIPGDREFMQVSKSIGKLMKGAMIDYDYIAARYNALPRKGILLVEVSARASLGNMSKVLEGRGLVRGQDYEMVRVKEDSKGLRIPIHKRPVAIERLSNNDMSVKQQ